MSYKFSRGFQIIGDLSGSDDANRDTGIDFEENEIKLVAGGTDVLKVSGSHVYLANGSDLHLAGNSTIFFDSDDGGSNINVSMTERPGGNGIIFDGRNRLRFRADQYVIFEAPDGTEPILINYVANPDVLVLGMNLSSSQDISGSKLHLQGGITNGGQTFLDSQGNLAAANANLAEVTSSNLSFSGDLFLNNTEKLIDSQGDHSLLQTMVVELSIPGTDVQTDSSAFRFFCPYDLTVDELQLNLDENNSGEAVTVQISGSGGFTQSLTLTGPTDNGTTGSLDGSLQAGELLNFEITSVSGTPQGLIANLLYRRTLP
jgi:hypothetical protein